MKGLLALLPEDTFRFIGDFVRGLPELGEEYCGQIGVYAKKESSLGDKGVSLIVVNEHLFGDPTSPEWNPTLRIPKGAENIEVIPPRQSPLKNSHPFAGVEFEYKGANFFFGYELSQRAYSTIVEALK